MSTEHVAHTRTHNGSRSVACAFEMLFLILTHCRIKQDVSACVWYFSFADFEASRRLWFPSSWRLYRNVHETQTYRRTSAWTQGDTHTVNAQYNRGREGGQRGYSSREILSARRGAFYLNLLSGSFSLRRNIQIFLRKWHLLT